MLPAEITDIILGFLQDDRATLKSCFTAHPLLSSFAERYLFVHTIVYLTDHGDHGPTDGFSVPQLARCLSKKPYLAGQIRSITIDASTSYPFPFSYELSTLLSSITHTEQLSLYSVLWFHFPKEFHLALLDFLQTAHMKTLNVHNSYFPMTLVDGLKNIKNLKIDASDCDFGDNAALPISISLEPLSLVDISAVDFTSWVPRLNTLVSLHVKDIDPWNSVSPIVTTCSGSLKNLTLEIGDEFHTPHYGSLNGFPFNLSSLTSLELLTVRMDISAWRSVDQTNETSYSCISSLLAVTRLAATAGPSLKRAVLNLDCAVGVISDLRDAVEWGPLVQLCDLPMHLQVDLYICTITGDGVKSSFAEVVDSLFGNEDVSRSVEQGSVVIKPLLD